MNGSLPCELVGAELQSMDHSCLKRCLVTVQIRELHSQLLQVTKRLSAGR